MKTNLDIALDYVFKNEGGFANVPQDHGGATTWGITRADASRWLKRPVSIQEMKAFPITEAKKIYESWFWRPLACDRIQDIGVAVALFDIGVVRGVGYPPSLAQRICINHGAHIPIDGHLGDQSIAAINAIDPAVFIRDFSTMVEAGFRSIVARNPSQAVFLRGWINRAHRLLTLINLKAA